MEDLKDPICDLRFLLNRGYRKKSAVKFVSDKYKLTVRQRNFLVRSVFSLKEAEEHRKKIVPIDKAGGECVIDGYNVLITVENILKGKEVFICDDGFVRDVAGVFGKHKITDVTFKAIDRIINATKEIGIKKATFIFDSDVSFSGELCEIVRKKSREAKLNWKVKTSRKADYDIFSSEGDICTSDTAIIKKAGRVLDLPRYIAKGRVFKLPECKDIYAPLE